MDDRKLTARLVDGTTAVLALAALGFVAAFGSNVPHADEWDTIAPASERPFSAWWILGHHNEHRFPLGRLLWSASLVLTGFDFRAGMVCVVALLALASVALTSAARRERGRAHLADAVIPALLLNFGHAFNLLMGYQVVYALFVAGSAGTVWLAARFRPTHTTWAFGTILLAFVTVQSGGFGLVATPFVLGWLGFAAVAGWRRNGRAAPAVLALGGIAVVAYSGWVFATRPPLGEDLSYRTARDALGGAAGYLGVGLGSWGDSPNRTVRRVAAALGCLAYLLATALLVRTARRHPEQRPLMVAAWLLLSGQTFLALATGYARGFGLQERYVTPSAVGIATCWLVFGVGRRVSDRSFWHRGVGPHPVAARPPSPSETGGPPRAGLPANGEGTADGGEGTRKHGSASVSTLPSPLPPFAKQTASEGEGPEVRASKYLPLLLALAVLVPNAVDGVRTGTALRAAAREIEADVRSGMPVTFVAGKHGGARVVLIGERMRDRLLLLKQLRCGAFAELADDPPMTAVPVNGMRLPLKFDAAVPLPDPGRRVAGLRLIGFQKNYQLESSLVLRWRGSDGIERAAVAHPPGVPGPMAATFLLNDAPTALRFEPDTPLPGVTVSGIEWLIHSEGPK